MGFGEHAEKAQAPRRPWWSRYPWLSLVVWALFVGVALWAHNVQAAVIAGLIVAVSVTFFALGYVSRD